MQKGVQAAHRAIREDSLEGLWQQYTEDREAGTAKAGFLFMIIRDLPSLQTAAKAGLSGFSDSPFRLPAPTGSSCG